MVYMLLFLMFLQAVSLVLMSQVMGELKGSGFARKHEQTLNTAMAGLSAGMNRIRAATDPVTGRGVIAALPCTTGARSGVVTGTVDGSAVYQYRVTVQYLASDPDVMTQAQVDAAAMSCPLASVPSYAFLSSTGSQGGAGTLAGSLGNRSVQASYAFSLAEERLPGGQVATSDQSLCWDAGAAPAVGTVPTFRACATPGEPAQLWRYRRDLAVQWYGDPAANLCLDWSGSALPVPDPRVRLETCVGSDVAGTAYDSVLNVYPYAGQMYQEFGLHSAFHTVTGAGDTDYSACVTSRNPTTGVYDARAVGDELAFRRPCATVVRLSSGVGAGGTGGVTNGLPSISGQLVNLDLASRCLDVANNRPADGLITWPCHQAPNSSFVEGNQTFSYTGTNLTPGSISTVSLGYYTTVCLESSGGPFATLTGCVAGRSTQQWQLTGVRPYDYAGSYLIKDYAGQCLTALAPPTGSLYASVGLFPCDGEDWQKWNAPGQGTSAALENIAEP